MVIQRSRRNADVVGGTGSATITGAGQPTSSSDDSNGSWPQTAPGSDRQVAGRTSGQSQNMPGRHPINRQVAINTLAAMHRRFSLPGPVQPHSRPVAEFRASANKSLDMLRQTIQSAVTREIDQVIKKYLEKFFVPAVTNIRQNLGEESVSEDQVRAVCRAMLDATRTLYSTQPRASPSPCEMSDSESSNGADSRFARQHSSPMYKRKESDTDSDGSGTRRKRIKQEKQEENPEGDAGGFSPLPPPLLRDPHKWNPARLTPDTLFIMGSHAHKVLGLGNSRGRLYTKHSTLLRYPADTADKEWIATHNLMNAVGGKTYIMVLEDIEELAATDHYRNNALPMLGELTGFKAPPFMLRKIKAFLTKRLQSTPNTSCPPSPQPSTSNDIDTKFIKIENEFIKTVIKEDIPKNTLDFPDLLTVKEELPDFDLIKVDDIKEEDIEEFKVDGIKVEDIDDLSVDGIKVDDIKLESDDAFSMKDEEQSQLVEGLLDADIEFLTRNLGNIESEADARKTIEKLTGANPDTLTLMGDEFDFGTTLNTNYSDNQQTKCITVASTTSGMIHSVPVAHLAAPSRITGNTLHYHYSSNSTVHHVPRAVTIHSMPSQVISVPVNTKGTFSTVMSTGTASIIGFTPPTSTTLIGNTTQYLNVTPKSFPTGNILHNAIVSRNMINRNFLNTTSSAISSYNVTNLKPIFQTTTAKITQDFDTISTTKDMIDNACNSSAMLKKVLTLGSAGAAKSYMMNNQKIISTGFSTGSTPPPNVTLSPHNLTLSPANVTLSPPNLATQHNITSSLSNVTFSQHIVTSSSPNATFPQQNATYSPPNVTFSLHNVNSSQPNVTFSQHSVSSSSPNVTFPQHVVTTSLPNVTFSQHKATSSPPNVTLPPPNVVVSGSSVPSSSTSSTLSATHATLSALLAGGGTNSQPLSK